MRRTRWRWRGKETHILKYRRTGKTFETRKRSDSPNTSSKTPKPSTPRQHFQKTTTARKEKHFSISFIIHSFIGCIRSTDHRYIPHVISAAQTGFHLGIGIIHSFNHLFDFRIGDDGFDMTLYIYDTYWLVTGCIGMGWEGFWDLDLELDWIGLRGRGREGDERGGDVMGR